MRVRRANTKDAAGIAAVHVRSWQETYPGIVPQGHIDALKVEDKTRDWVERLGQDPQGFTLVAEDGRGQLLGFASGGALRKELFDGEAGLAQRYDGELKAIYLLKAFHGQGLGRALFAAAKVELLALGHGSMLVRVLKENAARGFYERMGGVQVAENKIKIGVWLDELVYGWSRLA